MQIVCSKEFIEQLKNILVDFMQKDINETKKFKLYLDTVLYNLPTKVQKYKPSIYFENDDIKDIEHEGFIIPFYIDNKNNKYVILGIFQKFSL